MKAYNSRFVVVPFSFGMTIEELFLSAAAGLVLLTTIAISVSIHFLICVVGLPVAFLMFKHVYQSWTTHDIKRIKAVLLAGGTDARCKEL